MRSRARGSANAAILRYVSTPTAVVASSTKATIATVNLVDNRMDCPLGGALTDVRANVPLDRLGINRP